MKTVIEIIINCKITGNKVNRGAGNGLEIHCEYSADGDTQTVDRLKKKISCEKIIVETLININSDGLSRKRKQWTAESIKQLLYCVTVLISLDREHYNYFIAVASFDSRQQGMRIECSIFRQKMLFRANEITL